jgi:peptidoglycan hydrolase-like protein with peptidoglycan-binding domain
MRFPPIPPLLLAALLALATAGAAAEDRVALVIGNGAYESLDPLVGPAEDAADLLIALAALGFDVVATTDADNTEMRRAIAAFAERLSPGGIAVAYYAGHAISYAGRNYLLPVTVDPRKEFDFLTQGINANVLLGVMETAGGAANLLLLDAARADADGPGGPAGQGLSPLQPARPETVVALAAAPGLLSPPGRSRLLARLLEQLEEPGADLGPAIEQAAAAVRADSGGAEDPSITGHFAGPVLVGIAAGPDGEVAPAPTADELVAIEAALSDAELRDIQTALKAHGLYEGEVDGSFGPQTRAAIAAWQAGAGTEATGWLTPGERALLTAPAEPLAQTVASPTPAAGEAAPTTAP